MQEQGNYETLRSWYLAKLRKSAIEAQVSGQLTPSALIAADREVIEKLIAEKEESDEPLRKAARKNKVAQMYFLLLIWLYLLLALFVSLFIFCLADLSIMPDLILLLINPANLSASEGSNSPGPLLFMIVQLVLYAYPLCAVPYLMLSGR